MRAFKALPTRGGVCVDGTNAPSCYSVDRRGAYCGHKSRSALRR